MLKACSFLPAATRMIYDMGLEDLLHGVTFECHEKALNEKQIIVRCSLEGHQHSSEEIDRIFSASKAAGKSLYYVEEEKLNHIAPDVIFTQDVCEVCQIDSKCTRAVIDNLDKEPLIVVLTPKSLEDVFQTAVTIAKALGKEEAAYSYLSRLQERMDTVVDTLRKHRAPLKRVMLMEWMAPIYNCGHWIPYQIAYAGGVDLLSNPSGYSIVTSWEKIVLYNPEVLVIAPCGFEISRASEEIHLLTEKKEWNALAAVFNQRVFLADYNMFTQPSPSTLVDGIELLASLFHPAIFELPKALQHKVTTVTTAAIAAKQ
jgi:iron complex transport system substrate-binding protein